MVLIVDTREQKALDFKGIEGIEKIEDQCLPYGDYAAVVHDKFLPILVERKNMSDLFGTMTSGYDRFKKEMARAAEAKHKLILAVEGTYSEVYQGIEHSQFDGRSMVKKLAMLHAKYDLEVWYCETRRVMARRIVDLFWAIERHYAKTA